MRKIFNLQCDECLSHRILYDEHKGELFCFDCGLVLDERFAISGIEKYLKMMNASADLIR